MYAENWHLLIITNSIACSMLYSIAVCSCLVLASLFRFLRIGILIHTVQVNLSSDLVCIIDFLCLQHALLCGLFASHRMKRKLALLRVSGSIIPFPLPSLFLNRMKRMQPLWSTPYIRPHSFILKQDQFQEVSTPHSLFRSQCSSVQADYDQFSSTQANYDPPSVIIGYEGESL